MFSSKFFVFFSRSGDLICSPLSEGVKNARVCLVSLILMTANNRVFQKVFFIFLILFFNSREAIAAIIGGIVVFFYNSKNLNCMGALCFL